MRIPMLALAVIGVAAGCATSSARRTVAPEPVATEARTAPTAEKSPVTPKKRRGVAKTTQARPVLPVQKLAPEHHVEAPLAIDASLRKFAALRATFPRRKLAEMPLDVQRRWYTFFDEVETAALDDPQDGRENEELGVFIRTRVALEAEFEMDERRYRKIPEELRPRLRETLALVGERVRILRQLSTGFALHERLADAPTLYLRLPVQIVQVTSYFGHRRDPIVRKQTRLHAGVDFGGAEGALISSAGPGIVAYADWQGGSGNHVIVVHPNGYRTHYSHLARIFVEQGATVGEGTPLGVMGSTGRSTGPHLHFAVSRHGSFLDPLDVLDVPLTRQDPVPRS